MSSRPALLALRPLGLGDFLTAVPALRALRRAFPEHALLLACSPALGDLAACTGAVDAVLEAEPLQPLAIERAAVAVDLHGRGPASQRILLRTRPERLIAFANAEVPETRGMPSWRDGEHEVERWCRLLSAQEMDADPAALGIAIPRLRAGERGRGAVVVHPGAAYPARRWPADRFAALSRHLLRRGFRVLVTGSAAERALCAEVCGAAPGAETVAGETTLLELASLVSSAALVVSGDTGCAHLATATGTPSVLLFGPTPPALWGPPPDRPRHRVLWTGRRGDPHGTTADTGLLAITVADVVAAVDAQLDGLGAPLTAAQAGRR